MPWYDDLPNDLRSRAYSAREELAWGNTDALTVIDWLTKAGLGVCGIEVWLATDPGPTIPTPYFYHWESSKPPVGSTQLTQNNDDAKRYIGEFTWDEKDFEKKELAPYFNIVVF